MDEITQKPTVEQEIEKELEIDETKLAEELQRQPSRFFYYAGAWARAQRKFRGAKMQQDVIEARISKGYRDECLKMGMKPREITIAMVDEFCTLNEEVTSARTDVIQAEYLMEMLETAKQAFRQRGQSLVELHRTKAEEEFYADRGMEAMYREIDEKRGRKRLGGKGTAKEVASESQRGNTTVPEAV